MFSVESLAQAETFCLHNRILTMKDQDEQTTIAAILSGHPERYADLVTRYHIGLIIHCERIVGSRDDAEDVAQEAFIKAYQQLHKFNSKQGRFSTWLYKIATNIALDFLRRHKRQLRVDNLDDFLEATMPTYLQDEERRAVQKAVTELMPPEYRKVIEAYYWHGKNYQQIADELGTPINTIRTWMRRAKLQLKGKLA